MACLVACGASDDQSAVNESRCHTSDSLCTKRFDEVAFAMTHNGYSSEEDEFLGPNHKFGIEQQLEDGIRGFMLDVYDYLDNLTLCHANCEIGARPLSDVLEVYRAFLEENREISLLSSLRATFRAIGWLRAFRPQGSNPMPMRMTQVELGRHSKSWSKPTKNDSSSSPTARAVTQVG